MTKMKVETKYTDFPYCYDEERYFVSSAIQANKHEISQNQAISENTNLNQAQEAQIEELKKRVEELEEEIKKIDGGGGSNGSEGSISVTETIVLYPDDNKPSSDTEVADLTITEDDSFNDIIKKLANAIKSLNNTVDGDIFTI